MRDTALSSGHDVIPVQPGSSRERRNGHVKIQHWHKPHDAPTSACDGAVAASKADRWLPIRSGTDMARSEEHTSELPSLMRISYAVFCLTTKITRHMLHTAVLPPNHPTPSTPTSTPSSPP